MEHAPRIKQAPTEVTAEALARELTSIRSAYQELRRQTKCIGARTSRMYLELEHLKKSSRGNGR